MLSQHEKELINMLMVESGTTNDCIVAVVLRRLSQFYQKTIYNDLPAYSAVWINARWEVTAYVAVEWNNLSNA